MKRNMPKEINTNIPKWLIISCMVLLLTTYLLIDMGVGIIPILVAGVPAMFEFILILICAYKAQIRWFVLKLKK